MSFSFPSPAVYIDVQIRIHEMPPRSEQVSEFLPDQLPQAGFKLRFGQQQLVSRRQPAPL